MAKYRYLSRHGGVSIESAVHPLIAEEEDDVQYANTATAYMYSVRMPLITHLRQTASRWLFCKVS